MRIFITGASGYVGGVVTEHLVRAGHEVVALSMLDGLNEGAAFLYTSTGLVYPDTQGATVDEEHPVDPQSPQPFKIHGERQVLDAGHVAGTVIRAGLVYGRAGSGLLQGMLASARQQGMVAYIGEGTNEWSSVHVDDLAALYAAVLARRSPGTVVNAAGVERTPMRGIVEAVAATAGARAVSVTPEQAAETMGPAAAMLTRSSPLDSAKARRLFGWNPTSPNLLDELTSGSYVRASA
ncbi:NAD-dependent epimerase/dehydratase family protein [Microtetraspora sp. AC03309]|uniref:NAD-dependent epimerase/dehydratase family protein n=1 Tax=Microtetraspora sp. AC03309 TaxID=2779376 RepID=UPI001E39FA6C|nr:NAD-dependent epimerase/dehydratase family protein [Microtetraspora sp. AC03309]MCC5576261.1 NAD-dependent epimerase/dehydratase family protein [Microtetraspora sp. AC03309]